MTRKPKHCKTCRREIAIVTTDGADLFYGEIKIPLSPERIDFRCPYCGEVVRWLRIKKTLTPQVLVLES